MSTFKEIINKIEESYTISDINVEVQPTHYIDESTYDRTKLKPVVWEMTCNIEIKTKNKELMYEIQDYFRERNINKIIDMRRSQCQ